MHARQFHFLFVKQHRLFRRTIIGLVLHDDERDFAHSLLIQFSFLWLRSTLATDNFLRAFTLLLVTLYESFEFNLALNQLFQFIEFDLDCCNFLGDLQGLSVSPQTSLPLPNGAKRDYKSKEFPVITETPTRF